MKKYVINNGKEFLNKKCVFDEAINAIEKELIRIGKVKMYELTDYSYNRGENLGTTESIITKEGYPMKCYIVEEGLKIPAYVTNPGINNIYLDTKVESVNTGNIYYTQRRFLEERNNGNFNACDKEHKHVLGFTPNRSCAGSFNLESDKIDAVRYADIITPNLEIFVKTNNGTFEKYFVRKKQISDILDQKYKVVGYCKECNEPIIEGYKIPEYDMYECPRCAYPNSKDDMWYKSATIVEGISEPHTTDSEEVKYEYRPVDFIDFYKKNIQDNDTVINELKNKTLILTDDDFQTAKVGLNIWDSPNKQPETQKYSDKAKYIINNSEVSIDEEGLKFTHMDTVYTIDQLKNIR